MSNDPPVPVIAMLPASEGGGFRIHYGHQPSVFGAGPTIPAALQALSAEIARTYETEKGDDTAEASDAARRVDLVNNDRFVRGHRFQSTVLLAAAIGLI